MATPLVSWPRRAGVALSIAAGLAVLLYYTALLYREELRDWREVQALFQEVGGLRKDDDVVLGGTRVGRVYEIALIQDQQLVTLQVFPEVPLRRGAVAEVVATSALGFVEVRLDPGPLDDPPLAPGERIEGRVARGLAQGATIPGRRRLIAEGLRDVAKATEAIRDPESGTAGQLLFDAGRATSLHEGLGQLADTWAGIDAGLAQVEAGQGFGAGLDPASLDAVANTVDGLRQTLGGVARSLRDVRRGEGGAGRVLADPTQAASSREALLGLAEQTRDVRDGRGTLGRLSHPGSGLDEALEGTVGRWADATTDALAGEGVLGVLSSPLYTDSTRDALRRTPEAMEAFSRSPLVRRPDARRALADGLADVEDRMVGLRRSAAALRANQSSRTYVGAIFLVF
ncbi:MAG: MlaD family protein [Planctomycetes bacterium]|nr:MlaD family protein [Planctomycetota bacterium]